MEYKYRGMFGYACNHCSAVTPYLQNFGAHVASCPHDFDRVATWAHNRPILDNYVQVKEISYNHLNRISV